MCLLLVRAQPGFGLTVAMLALDHRSAVVKQLVALALLYGFDGWLLNFEYDGVLDAAQVASLEIFVREPVVH